jgi:ABC-type antimicrobial peptide transport system permease subunit
VRRFSGRLRSALIIGLQGIRARKLRTLLSMVSLFLGVLAVVVVQAGASIAEQALLADSDLTEGVDGIQRADVPPEGATIAVGTVTGRTDAVALLSYTATIGEPGVTPVNPGGSPLDQNWGGDLTAPKGQAVELRLTALTADVRPFRPYRFRSGRWLDFGTLPGLAPKLVLNEEAAKAFTRYRVPAQMHVTGATQDVTPQFIGVVDDGNSEPRAYVRMDELSRWLPVGATADPNTGGYLEVLLAPATPVTKVLLGKLRAAGVEASVTRVESRRQQEKQLALIRWIFLAMAGLVLVIGAAGVLNVGLATVGERVEEFALRRAVGTPRTLLAGIVLSETLLTGLLTAAAAIGTGAAALKVVSALAGPGEPMLHDVRFPWQAGVAGVIAGLVAGLLGGFVPALRAARIPIASVMRA